MFSCYKLLYVYKSLFFLILDALISYVCFRSDAFICVHCIVLYSSETEAWINDNNNNNNNR